MRQVFVDKRGARLYNEKGTGRRRSAFRECRTGCFALPGVHARAGAALLFYDAAERKRTGEEIV
jgi:hypothetical protein